MDKEKTSSSIYHVQQTVVKNGSLGNNLGSICNKPAQLWLTQPIQDVDRTLMSHHPHHCRSLTPASFRMHFLVVITDAWTNQLASGRGTPVEAEVPTLPHSKRTRLKACAWGGMEFGCSV